jgi:hypothetical protein
VILNVGFIASAHFIQADEPRANGFRELRQLCSSRQRPNRSCNSQGALGADDNDLPKLTCVPGR